MARRCTDFGIQGSDEGPSGLSRTIVGGRVIVPSHIFRIVDSATPVRRDTSSNEALGSSVNALTTLSYRRTLIALLLIMLVTESLFQMGRFREVVSPA